MQGIVGLSVLHRLMGDEGWIFDLVYQGDFNCNLRALKDCPALWAVTCDPFQHSAIRPKVDFDHVKWHYYSSHRRLNPSAIPKLMQRTIPPRAVNKRLRIGPLQDGLWLRRSFRRSHLVLCCQL